MPPYLQSFVSYNMRSYWNLILVIFVFVDDGAVERTKLHRIKPEKTVVGFCRVIFYIRGQVAFSPGQRCFSCFLSEGFGISLVWHFFSALCLSTLCAWLIAPRPFLSTKESNALPKKDAKGFLREQVNPKVDRHGFRTWQQRLHADIPST